jgi:capsular polysaccharide transport system ATP-binding protein
LISFKNVTKRFKTKNGEKYILNNYSGTLSPEKGIAILGGNGAGKSTLVRLISGTEVPTEGKIIRHKSCSWPMGLKGTFQPSMTGKDNIYFTARIYNQNPKTIFEEVKEFAEIGDYIYMPVNTYSNGMKARLAFGLSLAINFNIYLIDEIIAVGDKQFKQKSIQKLKERVETSRLIMVSHQLRTVKEFCDQCAILNDGKLEIYEDIEEGIKIYGELQEA